MAAKPLQRRSTKAGTVIPATRRLRVLHLRRVLSNALNEGRDRNPGDTRHSSRSTKGRDRNPGDTRSWRPIAACISTALNEGRDRNPGDTRRSGLSLNEGRDRNPGDTSARCASRSTKAGTVIPATRASRLVKTSSTKAGTAATQSFGA